MALCRSRRNCRRGAPDVPPPLACHDKLEWLGIDPIIEIRDPKTLRSIESILQAAFGSLAFIYFAARTAPNHRQITSIVLAGIIVTGLPILAWWWNAHTISNGSGILIEHGFGRIFANVIGAAAAIYLIRSHERKEFSPSG